MGNAELDAYMALGRKLENGNIALPPARGSHWDAYKALVSRFGSNGIQIALFGGDITVTRESPAHDAIAAKIA